MSAHAIGSKLAFTSGGPQVKPCSGAAFSGLSDRLIKLQRPVADYVTKAPPVALTACEGACGMPCSAALVQTVCGDRSRHRLDNALSQVEDRRLCGSRS